MKNNANEELGRLSRVPSAWVLVSFTIALIFAVFLCLVLRVENRLSEVLSPIPSTWSNHAYVLTFLLVVSVVVYGQELGHRTVEEGRAKLMFGMVPNFTAIAELVRAARTGDRLAQFLIWSQYLWGIAFVAFVAWPKA